MTVLLKTRFRDYRNCLIQAATEVFVEEGYGASVGRVAARAGVARQTLYNYFPHKADLFSEIFRQSMAALLIVLDANYLTIRERLVHFGGIYRDRTLSTVSLGLYRALAAEVLQFPELAVSVYRSGQAQVALRLSVTLKEAMTKGEMRSASPEFAANLLLSMLVGDLATYLFSGDSPPDTDPEQLALIIDCYLRAFAPVAPEAPPI